MAASAAASRRALSWSPASPSGPCALMLLAHSPLLCVQQHINVALHACDVDSTPGEAARPARPQAGAPLAHTPANPACRARQRRLLSLCHSMWRQSLVANQNAWSCSKHLTRSEVPCMRQLCQKACWPNAPPPRYLAERYPGTHCHCWAARSCGSTISDGACLQRMLGSSTCCSASRPGAATTPAWRMPPPSILRSRRARAINTAGPASMEPIGAPSPCRKAQYDLTIYSSKADSCSNPLAWSLRGARRPCCEARSTHAIMQSQRAAACAHQAFFGTDSKKSPSRGSRKRSLFRASRVVIGTKPKRSSETPNKGPATHREATLPIAGIAPQPGQGHSAPEITHLGQAELHAGDVRSDRGHVHAERLRCVEHARAVQMDWHPLRSLRVWGSVQVASATPAQHVRHGATVWQTLHRRKATLRRPGAVTTVALKRTINSTLLQQAGMCTGALQRSSGPIATHVSIRTSLRSQSMYSLRHHVLATGSLESCSNRVNAIASAWHGAPALQPMR